MTRDEAEQSFNRQPGNGETAAESEVTSTSIVDH